MRVLRVLEALGGSLVYTSRVWELPGGGPISNQPKREARRLAEVSVSRVLEALGGSFVRVLRVREAPAGSRL